MMSTRFVAAFGVACFTIGALVQAGVAQGRKPVYSAELFKKEPSAVATELLDGALQLAENGSWERIAVGRAWYLGGDKARGQRIFDEVTSSKKVERSDWIRVARVYVEANEWEQAQQAFDKALPAGTRDDTGLVEYGGYALLHHDRAKAEELFNRAFLKNKDEFWHWVNAGGAYLGVAPQ